MTETEQIIVGLISSAGQSKSLAFEALKKVKTGEYELARDLIEELINVFEAKEGK